MSAQQPPKTQAVQQQVDEVVGIMQENIHKVMARGEHLDSLQNKTEDLQASSMQFRRGANKVRKQMWWKDMKMKLILGGVIVAIILIVVFTSIKAGSNNNNAPPNTTPAASPSASAAAGAASATIPAAASPTSGAGSPAPQAT